MNMGRQVRRLARASRRRGKGPDALSDRIEQVLTAYEQADRDRRWRTWSLSSASLRTESDRAVLEMIVDEQTLCVQVPLPASAVAQQMFDDELELFDLSVFDKRKDRRVTQALRKMKPSMPTLRRERKDDTEIGPLSITGWQLAHTGVDIVATITYSDSFDARIERVELARIPVGSAEQVQVNLAQVARRMDRQRAHRAADK